MNNSRQRNLILSIVNESTSHPNANDIYLIAKKSIPNISLGTVYRNLNVLLQKDMIKKIHTSDNVEKYDKIFNKHNHFICNKCEKIYDIFKDSYSIPMTIDGHRVIDCDVTYTGICKNCVNVAPSNKVLKKRKEF